MLRTLNMLTYIFVFMVSLSFADEIITTKGGKKVNLKDNGTWEFVSKKEIETKNTKSNSNSYRLFEC